MPVPPKPGASFADAVRSIALEGDSIRTVMTIAGSRYAIVTQNHMRAPAHSWSWSGERPKSPLAE